MRIMYPWSLICPQMNQYVTLNHLMICTLQITDNQPKFCLCDVVLRLASSVARRDCGGPSDDPEILQFVRGRVRRAELRGFPNSLYSRLPQTDSSPLRPFCLRFPLTPLPLLSSSFQGSVTLKNTRFLSNDYPSCNCKDPV